MNAINSNRNLRPPSPSLRLPSRRRISSLTVRTTDSYATPSSVSSIPPDSLYPIPIPPEKLAKALKLYRTWKTTEGLAQLDETSSAGNDSFLHPTTPTARSRTSGGSSRRHGTSVVSASSYAATDMTSVLSFDGNPTSAHELTNFNGKIVKQRTRRAFPPAEKARTALVRYLSSCQRCRERRVKCPLEEHHDIAHLERLYAQLQGENHSVPPGPRRPRSSGSNSSQRTARSISGRQEVDNTDSSRTDFFGIGQNPQLLQPYSSVDAHHYDIQSPGGADPLAGISANPTFTTVQFPSEDQTIVGPTVRDQNGLLFKIGRKMGLMYLCEDSECSAYYDDIEELQTHFEARHFQFQRLDNPIRHSCFVCDCEGVDPWSLCSQCGNRLVTWVVGHRFRIPTFYHNPSDGPAGMSYDNPASPYNPVVQPPQDEDPQWTQNLDGAGGYDNADGESYRDEPADQEPYGDMENMDFEYNNFYIDNTYDDDQGNEFRSARPVMLVHSIRCKYLNAKHYFQRRKLFFFFAILLAMVLMLSTYNRKITSLLSLPRLPGKMHQDHLPKVGFMVMLASFSTSLLLRSSLCDASSQIVSGSSFRALVPYTVAHRPPPHTYIQCTGYS